MHKTIVGMADSYGTAERIVEDLEQAGIVGSEVQVISDADDKVTGFENTSAKAPREGFTEKIRNFFHSHTRSHENEPVVDDTEVYASRIRDDKHALIIVRLPDVPEDNRAVEILRAYRAVDPRGGDQPGVFWEEDLPASTPLGDPGKKKQTMGDDALTTGGTRADLEGRGTKIRQA
ncbi:MAG TPA: hypothetical protein VG322_16555 [Candidatus Acidoferrales bacterium]|jgi:hypothetical protein|nr:hypothetical protein [Candidatus Acidoferrales bacterium]